MPDAPIPKILLVEDDAIFRMLIRRLVGLDFQIGEAATLKDARAMLACEPFACALVDYRLPDGTGFDLLPHLTEITLPAIMMTALGHPQLSREAIAHGCRDYLPKESLTRSTLFRSLTDAMGGS